MEGQAEGVVPPRPEGQLRSTRVDPLPRGPSLWECSPNLVLEVEIGLSETVPQTPRPIYFLRILLERYSEHPIGHPYTLSQRNTEPSKVPFLLSKRVG